MRFVSQNLFFFPTQVEGEKNEPEKLVGVKEMANIGQPNSLFAECRLGGIEYSTFLLSHKTEGSARVSDWTARNYLHSRPLDKNSTGHLGAAYLKRNISKNERASGLGRIKRRPAKSHIEGSNLGQASGNPSSPAF